MKLIEKIEDFPAVKQPLVLTIGTFDGMHRGHRAVLRRAKEIGGSEGQTAVITFRNHPSDVLRPQDPTPLLCTLPHKLRLIEEAQMDVLLLLNFTRYFARHSAASFIEKLRQTLPFSHLVLGHDATLGRDRQGNRSTMLNLGDEWGFSVHYIDEYRYEGVPLSSTSIREQLQKGELERVEQLLARPYSIYSTAQAVENSRMMIDVAGLCLPPAGNYVVEVIQGNDRMAGIAMLSNSSPVLEVNFPEEVRKENFSESPYEIVFKEKM